MELVLQFLITLDTRWDKLLRGVEDFPRKFASIPETTRTIHVFTYAS